MVDRPDRDTNRQDLSALMDGAADGGAMARALGAWRDDVQCRADWHAYHLIGDVLRSDDLAHAPARDEAFLAAVRMRLASEPVVLAPAPTKVPVIADAAVAPRFADRAPARRRGRWLAPAAVAAGFMAVSGVLVVTRLAEPVNGDAQITRAPSAVPPGFMPVSNPQPVTDGRVIRDARLDRYLAEHKRFGTSSAVAVPAVVLRNATTAAPAR